MPRFNAQGDLCIGLGRDWFDHRTIAQECNTLRPGCVIALSDGTIVAERGANYVCAGGGVWAAWLGGYGLYDSLGSYYPDSGLGPAGPGCYARKVQYFSYGPWVVHERDGSEWLLTNGDAYDIQLLGDRKALWREAGQLHTRGFELADPIPTGESWWPRAVLVNGEYRLLYQAPQGLIFHGRVVATGKAFYRPDAIQIGDSIHFCWSIQEQEYGVTPEPLVMPIAALLALPVLQNVGSSPQVPTLPHPSPEPIPVPVSIPNYKDVVKNVRMHFPNGPLSPENKGLFLIHVCDAVAANHPPLKPGLHRKGGGKAAKLWNGVTVDADLIVFPDGHLFDVLGEEEKLSTATWIDEGIHVNSISQYYDVLAANPPVVNPTPNPQSDERPEQPAEPSADLDALRNGVAALRVTTAMLKMEHELLSDHLMGAVLSLTDRLNAAEQRTYRVVIDDSKDAPRLSTSKEFGHAHRIALKVEPA